MQMSSVKECFSKGIGYIKLEINTYEDEKNELIEFLGYHTTPPRNPLVRERIKKEKDRLDTVERKLKHLYIELEYYKNYFRYTQAEINAIPAATEESIKRDEQIELLEMKHNTWTIDDTRRVFAKAGIILD